MSSSRVVRVKDHLLALSIRANCDKLFDYIESLPEDHIIVDFSGFNTASRSFIHQYLLMKANSSKKERIEEINLSPTIEGLFRIVKKQIEEPRIVSSSSS
ncbi:MAG: hypothetical protein QW416_08965 [Candidatus Nitrosocaldaceae archaeon]